MAKSFSRDIEAFSPGQRNQARSWSDTHHWTTQTADICQELSTATEVTPASPADSSATSDVASTTEVVPAAGVQALTVLQQTADQSDSIGG